MDKIFASKPGRRRFIFTISLLLVFLLLIRFYVFPINSLSDHSNENFISFLDKFATSVFTAIIVGYFLYWVQGDEKKKYIDFTESGSEIEKYLNQGRLSTDIWYFNGGLGRYTKSDTLPKLSQLAVSNRKTIVVKIIVINPFNEEILKKYINFRISVEKELKKNQWTELEVQSEILATIVTAFFYKSRNQFLDVEIKVKNFFTLSRMDISTGFAVITREDPAIPSIVVEKDSYMYKHYSEEFQQVDRQSEPLNYEFGSLDLLTKEDISRCFSTVFPNSAFNPNLIEVVHAKFINPKNPFA